MNPYFDTETTIIALATPPGKSALGIIRASGSQSINLANQIFKGKNLLKVNSHTLHYGYIIDDKQQIIDEVMVSVFKAPKSFTTQNMVEISCHGSPYILQQVMQQLLLQGARMANPGEFTLRAFLNARIDLSQAEAVADLIASESHAAQQIAIQQIRGGFSSQITLLRQQLVNFASLIELELDFAEEDVTFADRQDLMNLVNNIKAVIAELIQSFNLGNVLKNGVSTVIAGRPNAGKSTLLNALLNEERAIVSPIAGTTRDTIEEVLTIDGIDFRLIDTAGLRQATNAIEKIGVQKTIEKIKQSAVVLYIFDVNKLSHKQVLTDIQQLNIDDNIPIILVANKIDEYKQPLKFPNCIPISAQQGNNIAAIKQALKNAVNNNNSIPAAATIVSNARHYEALQSAYTALNQVTSNLNLGISGDLLALDIRTSLRYLGQITGSDISPDELLGNIFSKFCIGK